MKSDLLKEIGRIADQESTEVYTVGGYVRDQILNQAVIHPPNSTSVAEPSGVERDIDFTVVGDGIQFARKVAQILKVPGVVTYEKFGTAMVPVHEHKLEFVGTRKENYLPQSRNPEVTLGTLEDDLKRRDFTINAMAISLNAKTYGKMIDLFDGRGDLARKLIRTPLNPEVTFSDDPLRILRAIRFACQYQYQIEPGTFEAMTKMGSRLKIISQERVSEEILKIIRCKKPSIGFGLMLQSNILEFVFPELAEMPGVEQRMDYHHKDVFWHTLQVVDNISTLSEYLPLRLAALLHDVAKPRTKEFKEGTGWTFHGHEDLGARMVPAIFRRMRLPLDYMNYVQKLVKLHLRPIPLVREEITDSAVRRLLFEAGKDIEDLMMLCRADVTSKNPEKISRYSKNFDIVEKKMKEVEEKDRLRSFQPPLRGDEIMSLFSLKPGPVIGAIKKQIEEAILDGVIPNEHDAALQYMMKIKNDILTQYDDSAKPKKPSKK